MSKEAMKLALEAAYLAGFNASGEGYNGEYPFQDHNAHPAQDEGWCQNRDAYIRKALAEQPAPMIRGDIRDGLVDDEPAHQHIEHCLWARNGNQPCPHVQPAQQQEPVAVRDVLVKIARFLGIVRVYAQDTPPKQELETDKPLHWKARELQDEVIRLLDTTPQAQPAQRKPLTDEQLRKVHHEDQFGLFCDYDEFEQIARAIEAKLREKNQ